MRRAGVRVVSAAVVSSLLMVVVACKTQDDAVAAAQQMTKTAQALSDYYDALDKVVAATESTREARYLLNDVPANTTTLEDTRHLLQERKDLAGGIAALAAQMQQLTAATASKDSATAASQLTGQLQTLGAFPKSAEETKGVSVAVQVLLQGVLAHDEVKAAKEIEPVTKSLAALFKSEEDAYASVNDTYLTDAKATTKLLIDKNQVDVSPLFQPALVPFDLQPSVTTVVKVRAKDYMLSRLDAQYSAKLAASAKATQAMAEALDEMESRVALVTADQPMKIRMEPLSLEKVRGWVDEAKKELQ